MPSEGFFGKDLKPLGNLYVQEATTHLQESLELRQKSLDFLVILSLAKRKLANRIAVEVRR